MHELADEWEQATDDVPFLDAHPVTISQNNELPDGPGLRYWKEAEDRYRMSHHWFNRKITKRVNAQFSKPKNIVIYHFTPEERQIMGLPETINGTYWLDNNDILEAFICCEPDALAEDPRATTGIYELVRLFLHEAGHGLVHFSGRREEMMVQYEHLTTETSPIHFSDYAEKDVRLAYKRMNFQRWSLLAFLMAVLQVLIPIMAEDKKKLEKPPVQAPPPAINRREKLLDRWAEAIKDFEGWFPPGDQYPKGSRSYRQNNPGNLRWSPFESDNIDNFSVFPTYEEGMKALKYQIELALDNRSKVYHNRMTLYDFFGTYAPSSDNNHPRHYAEYVARQLGVSPSTEIRDLNV